MSAADLFVLRHGEPEDRTIFYGQLDVGLSDRGHQHVRDQVGFFANRSISEIVSSDLHRCRFGADAIGDALGLPVRTTETLREMHLGVLEGVPIAEAMKSHPGLAGRSYADMLDYAFEGGGETVREVQARAKPEVERVIRSTAEGGAIILYVHNTIARLVLSWAAGLGPQGYVRFEQRYGAINRVKVFPRDNDPWARSAIVWSNRRAAPA